MVRVDSEKNIDFAANSSLAGGRPGRNKRRSLKTQKKNEEWYNYFQLSIMLIILSKFLYSIFEKF